MIGIHMSAAPSMPAGASIEIASPPQPEKSPYRQNVTSKELLGGKPVGQNNTEKAAIVIGRKLAQLATTEDLTDTWEGSVASYALMSGIKHGDSFQGGISLNHQGRDVVITHTDEPDENQKDAPICLRMGKSADVISLDDYNAQEAEKALRYLTTVPNERRGEAEIQVVQAVFEGKQVDDQVVVEVAKSHGYMTPDVILDISKGIMDKDGQPLITDEDRKTLSGEKRPDGETAPPLSPKAVEIQTILGSDIILSPEQVKDALFALEIPTDGRQLGELTDRYSTELRLLRVRREKTTFSSDDKDADKKIKQMDDREKWLQDRIESYSKVSVELKKETGSEKFDTVQLYYDLIQEGGGDATILEDFKSVIIEPTIDNITRFDESYETRCKTQRKKDAKTKAKDFARKFIQYGGVGFAGLIGIQIWRAKKKNDEGNGPQ